MSGEPSEIGGLRIVRKLGKGGMGAVFEAIEPGTERHVALKVLLSEAVADGSAVARFEREGRAAASVDHVHVARVHRIGRDARTGQLFLVSELVRGGSLHDKLKAEGPLPWRRAASLGAQIARGLEAIHRAQLVHRDLKPANVLLDEEGRARITDFGLVRSVGAESKRLTATGELLGTLEFLAPEQAGDGREVGCPADLYALGCTLFALVSGAPPFAGAPHALIFQHLEKAPDALSSRAPDVPRPLDALVARLLEKDPARRGTAGEVAAELESIARSEPASSPSGTWVAIAAVVALFALVPAWWLSNGASPAPAISPHAISPPVISPRALALPELHGPSWYEALPPSERPSFPLPQGLSFGKNRGEYVNVKDGSVLVFVPAGPCSIGSEDVERRLDELRLRGDVGADLPHVAPVRAIALSAYFVGKYEARFAQFRAFVLATGHRTTAERVGTGSVNYRTERWEIGQEGVSYLRPEGSAKETDPRPDEPVVQVSYQDARAYCEWAGLTLPSEAQWERAALWDAPAHRSRIYTWGDDEPGKGRFPDRKVANVRDATLLRAWNIQELVAADASTSFAPYDDGFETRAPVGSFPDGASPVGALDMIGNVAEWCLDSYDAGFWEASPTHDPVNLSEGDKKVFRGGGWVDRPVYELGAVRQFAKSTYRTDDTGFRVARPYP